MKYFSIDKVKTGSSVYRVRIVFTGCDMPCLLCTSEDMKDYESGKTFGRKDEKKLIKLLDNANCVGLSIAGGDPLNFGNAEGTAGLCRRIKENLPWQNITIFTSKYINPNVIGRVYRNQSNPPNHVMDMGRALEYADTLVTKTCCMTAYPVGGKGNVTWTKETKTKWVKI